MSRRKNKKYSKELKQQAVQEYLVGKGSYETISKKYELLSNTQLKQWVKVYNGHKEFSERSGSGSEIYMTKGRKTTQQERVKIVAFCIEHGKDYPLTIKEYDISYQQIYSWVRKYEENGIDGLVDGRGKIKPEEKMTENEKLKAQIRLLEAKNYDLKMENALTKSSRNWKKVVIDRN